MILATINHGKCELHASGTGPEITAEFGAFVGGMFEKIMEITPGPIRGIVAYTILDGIGAEAKETMEKMGIRLPSPAEVSVRAKSFFDGTDLRGGGI